MRVSSEQVRRVLEPFREREGTPRPPALDPDNLIAAVAVTLSPHNPVQLLLIRRAMSARDPWSQHMAFPGGKLEARDASLRATAIRETCEELGLNLEESADYLGPLPALSVALQGRKIEIKPFVFGLRHVPELALNHEVDKVIWVPLESLSNGSMDTTVVREHAGQSHTFPAWGVSGHQVWGLTYRMIQSLLTILRENA